MTKYDRVDFKDHTFITLANAPSSITSKDYDIEVDYAKRLVRARKKGSPGFSDVPFEQVRNMLVEKAPVAAPEKK